MEYVYERVTIIYINFANLQVHTFSKLSKCVQTLEIFHFHTCSLQTNSTADIS